MRRTLWFAGIVVALAIMGLAWYGGQTWRGRFASRADGGAVAATSSDSGSAPAPTGTARGDVTIDARRQQLIGVRTARVTEGPLNATVRAVGTVRYDETRLTDLNVKVEAWIRDLFVNATGQAITQGQPLASVYSPDIRTTATEYALARKTRDTLREATIPEARVRADALVASAQAKLALWDVPVEFVRAIEDTGLVPDTVVFRSPLAGVVIEKPVVKGQHVTPGQSLYKIADLSVVWIEADVHELDLASVRVGDQAVVTVEAYPGRPFHGRVIYVYPYLEESSRTNRVRLELPNADGRLRPGMFATVDLTPRSGTGLTVPADAVLDSGSEQVVFVAHGEGVFEPRRVTVGRRLGDVVEIRQGVKAGEDVATSAAFFLDSESQLHASLQNYQAVPGAGDAVPAAHLSITLRTDPPRAKTGENQFEASVKDASGAPVTDAEVSVQLFMPAMPTMNMPAMRNEVALSAAGGGLYRGTGQVMMAGRWEATVTVTRHGTRLGSTQLPLVAQ